MADIDNFKDYNDRHGHAQGNTTLRIVAQTLVAASREEDVVARYGGEEFVLIMPETSKEDAAEVADRARKALAEHELAPQDPTHRVKISVGVAHYPGDATSFDDLIRCADRAMYIAKARGKNQVQLYGANRRAHLRINAVVEGKYRIFEEELRPFSTLDLSERSLRVRVDHDVPENSLVEFTLMLPEHGQKVFAHGRVIRATAIEGDAFELVLSIVDITSREHLTLKHYLSEQGPAVGGTLEPPEAE